MHLKPKAIEYCNTHCNFYGKVYCEQDTDNLEELCDNCPIEDFVTFCESEEDYY